MRIKKNFTHDRMINGTSEWLTPPMIIESLGVFDLDPCSPVPRPWDTAREHYDKIDNGLSKPWHGRVWLNPPYGSATKAWLHRMAKHGNGIVLIFARTETSMFFDYVWGVANSILFIKGRVAFYHKDGTKGESAGAPSVLIAYGEHNSEALSRCGVGGYYIDLSNARCIENSIEGLVDGDS